MASKLNEIFESENSNFCFIKRIAWAENDTQAGGARKINLDNVFFFSTLFGEMSNYRKLCHRNERHIKCNCFDRMVNEIALASL